MDIMSTLGNVLGDESLVDLKELRADYRKGHSAMGHPSRGYYVTSNRGMESLQAFATSEMVSRYFGDGNENNVREVKITNDGKNYDMKAWTDRRFADNLNTGLLAMDEDAGINRGFWDKLDERVYEAVIDNVYDGDMDKEAFLMALTDRQATGHATDYISAAMKLDVLRAKDGDKDDRALAGAYAYQSVLAKNARRVDFDYEGAESMEDKSLGPRYAEFTPEQWYQKAEMAYVDHLLDSYDDTITDTFDINDGKALMQDFYENDAEWDLTPRKQEWKELVNYLKRDIVFPPDIQADMDQGLGMRYQSDVHDVFDIDSSNQFEDDYYANPSSTFNLDEDDFIDNDDAYDQEGPDF